MGVVLDEVARSDRVATLCPQADIPDSLTGCNLVGAIRWHRLLGRRAANRDEVKGDTDSLVTICGEDVRKIDTTKFEMWKTEFTPEGNLAALILKKITAQ
jgi:hypothetical protein